MATFGSTINPALGRVDYSPLMQGAGMASQGIMQGAQGIAQGLGDALKQFERNKEITSKSIGVFEGVARNDPDFLKALSDPSINPKIKKAAEKLSKSGSVSPDDATMLAGFAATYQQSKQEQMNRQIQQFQLQQMQQAQTQRQAQEEAVIQTAKLTVPILASTLAQLGVGKDQSDAIVSGLGKLDDKNIPPGVRAAMANGLLEQSKALVSAQNMAAEAGIRGKAADAKIAEEQRNIFLENMANVLNQTGQIPPYVKKEDVYTIQQLAAEKMKKGTQVVRSVDAQGRPVQVTTMPGREPITSPIQSPFETPADAAQKKFAETLGADNAATVQKAIAAVPMHQNTLDNITAARDAYAKGATTGMGLEALNAAKGYINTMFGGNLFDLSRQEYIGKSLQDFALDAAARMAKQGQITEREREMLAKTVAQYRNTPAGNLLIMEFMEEVAKREIQKAEFFADLADKNQFKSKTQVEFYRNNPITLPTLNPKKPVFDRANSILSSGR